MSGWVGSVWSKSDYKAISASQQNWSLGLAELGNIWLPLKSKWWLCLIDVFDFVLGSDSGSCNWGVHLSMGQIPRIRNCLQNISDSSGWEILPQDFVGGVIISRDNITNYSWLISLQKRGLRAKAHRHPRMAHGLDNFPNCIQHWHIVFIKLLKFAFWNFHQF